MWRRRGPDPHPRRRRRRGGQGGGGTCGGDVVRRRGHRAREVTGSPTEEHFLGSVRRGIGTGGEVAGSGGGGEGRSIIPHPDGGGDEVGGSAGCRGRRRRRGPAAAAGCQGGVVGWPGGDGEVPTTKSPPPRPTRRGRDGPDVPFCETAPKTAGVALRMYAHSLHACSGPKAVRRVCKRGKAGADLK